jgi:hypothetical protein
MDGSDSLEKHEVDAGEDSKRITIAADIAASFTYASYQNAIPVIRSILIENTDRADSTPNSRVPSCSARYRTNCSMDSRQ